MYHKRFSIASIICFVLFLAAAILAEDGQVKTIEPYTIRVPQEIKDAATPEPIPEPTPTITLDPTHEVSRGDYSREDVLLIAKLIWEEARGESYEGMVAIGEVILNRVEYDAWSDSVQGVIYQEGQFAHISGNYNETTLRAAIEASEGSSVVDGSQYFFNPNKCSPSWADDYVFVQSIGGHDFYRRP